MLSEVKCDSDMYTKNMEKCQRKALEVWVMYMKVPRETTDDICFFCMINENLDETRLL